MIDLSRVQEALVLLAKSDPALVTLVDDEIREESWMGRTYTYPNVRIDLSEAKPEGLDGCDSYIVTFNVAYRDNSTSSAGCLQGITTVIQTYEGQLLGYLNTFVSMATIEFVNIAGPIPEAKDEWMARAFFTVKLLEL